MTFLMLVALSNLNRAITPSRIIKIVRIPVNSGVKFAYPTGSILKYEYTSIVRSVGLVAKTMTEPIGSISKNNAIPCNASASSSALRRNTRTRCTRIKPSTPERSATPCRKAASASGSRSATSGAGPPANAPKTPDIRRPQGVYTPKTNKNRAPAQESLPLRGRCHFRGKQPMK